MKEFLGKKEEWISHFGADTKDGLTDQKAKQNARQYGRNILTRQKADSLWKRIWTAAKEPMILMLMAAGGIALLVNIIRAVTGSETDFLECIGVFAAILLSIAITVSMEGKSARAFEALNQLNEDTQVKVLREGRVLQLHQKEIVAGDILSLSAGDKIPADGRLLESMELTVNESVLTGESLPVSKEAEFLTADETTPVAERRNMLYRGTYITAGVSRLLVTAVGDTTEFGKIAAELSGKDPQSTPLQEKLARLGKMITVFGILAAVIVFLAQLIFFARQDELAFGTVMDAFITSIILIVAAVPEGLPTIVAVSLSMNIIKLSKQNALVKKMIASETVGCINIICSDKTGTLTQNKMTVHAIWDDRIVCPEELENPWMLENFCMNGTAELDPEDQSFIGNPTECALLAAAGVAGYDYRERRDNAQILHMFPFSSEEKHMTTVVKRNEAALCYTKGSLESILSMCNLSPEQKQLAEEVAGRYQRQACRVLAFSHKEVSLDTVFTDCHETVLESGMQFDGFAVITDPLREDVYRALEQCKSAGVTLKILTGDNLLTAVAIAEALGLLDESHEAVEAKDIEHLTDEELLGKLGGISVIARSTPVIKMRVVELLRSQGNVVAVTGDGINDAPALKHADVGIAMGISGTEVSKEASDIVLLNDSFSTIVHAIQWGRGIYENFKRFISFQLTVNVSSVLVVLVSILLGLKTPFTALQLLWINILMDGPPALTLGFEPVQEDLMKRMPTDRKENILSKALLMKVGITGLFISAVFLMQYTRNFLGASPEQMPTVLFALFALFQLLNVFNCRVLYYESIVKSFFQNRILLVVIGVTFALQIILIQFGGAFFGTIPLSIQMWLKLLGTASSVIVLSEILKAGLRCRAHRRRA